MWAVALSRRVEGRSGGFKGVVVAYVDLDYFRRLYEGIDLKAGSNVSLLNSNGEVLVSYLGSNNPSDRIFPEYLFRELLAQAARCGQAAACLRRRRRRHLRHPGDTRISVGDWH
jgi:hypothetical protein